MSMRTGLGCTVLFAWCACVEEPGPWWGLVPEFEWEGDFVTVYGHGREEAQACGESIEATDAYIGSLVDFYDADTPVHVDYHWFSQRAWDDFGPCADTYACTYRGHPLTRKITHAHELVHAVLWDLDATCMSTLEEGLAEYFSAARLNVSALHEFGKGVEEILVLDKSNYYRLPSEDYEQAGHFVSFLIEDYGISGVRDLCKLVPHEATLDDWDAATWSALGMSLADVLAEYASYPVCQHHGYRVRLSDCAGEPDVVVSPTEDTVFSLRVGCDEPEAIGERDGMVTVVKRVRADAPQWYEVVVEESDDTPEDPTLDVKLVIEQCAPCSEEPYVAEVTEPPPDGSLAACTWVWSPRECGYRELSGTHAFIFFLPADLERDITVRIEPSSLPLD